MSDVIRFEIMGAIVRGNKMMKDMDRKEKGIEGEYSSD